MDKSDSDPNSYMNNLTRDYTKGFLWYITYLKMLYLRGIGYISMGITILSLLTFLKVWQDTFNHFGISNEIMFIGFPIVVIIGCVTIGYIDVKNKMWHRESVFAAINVSPIAVNSYNATKHIEAEIELLREGQNKIMKKLGIEMELNGDVKIGE